MAQPTMEQTKMRAVWDTIFNIIFIGGIAIIIYNAIQQWRGK